MTFILGQWVLYLVIALGLAIVGANLCRWFVELVLWLREKLS
jgi:hypothetical protein